MKDRCSNPNDSSWKNYGGRGITVDPRWHNFENFYADMGDRPEGAQIDRIDNELGYSLENCHWATRSQNCRNRRTTRHVEFEGEVMSLADAAERSGLSYATLQQRLNSKTDTDVFRPQVSRQKLVAALCTLFITFEGERMSVKDAARLSGVPYATLRARVQSKTRNTDLFRPSRRLTKKEEHHEQRNPIP